MPHPPGLTPPGVWEQVRGNWMQWRGEIRKAWGKLTNNDLDMIAGQRDILKGILCERYGVAKEEADRQIHEWEDKIQDQ
jgi:uncharacterized protein YjbJ (UPF0337 family)